MIGYYRTRIAELQQLNKRLENLKGDLNSNVLPKLNNILTSMSDAELSLKEAFLVDNETADGSSIETNKSNVGNCISTISGSVIPSIDSKIATNNNQISNYNSLIQAELARIEEEEKARRETK